jgi:hypothetical protein
MLAIETIERAEKGQRGYGAGEKTRVRLPKGVVSPTGRGVVLLSLISRISCMLKVKQSVSLYVESKDDKR